MNRTLLGTPNRDPKNVVGRTGNIPIPESSHLFYSYYILGFPAWGCHECPFSIAFLHGIYCNLSYQEQKKGTRNFRGNPKPKNLLYSP